MYGGIFSVLEELKVKNIIIGKQFESSQNYQKFLEIIKKKKINVRVVETNSKVYIENNLYFDVLWPDSSQMISKNSINNNALVCKLNYKNFSLLFTGDIEEEAEESLVLKYKKNLKATILKVGHHGSKTSSIKKFIKLVKPKIALIGVGKNNNFGHPSKETIETLNNNDIKIYRTDLDGEIEIIVNDKGKVKIKKFV